MNKNNNFTDEDYKIIQDAVLGAKRKLKNHLSNVCADNRKYMVDVNIYNEKITEKLLRQFHKEFVGFIKNSEFLVGIYLEVTWTNPSGKTKTLMKARRYLDKKSPGTINIYHDYIDIPDTKYRKRGIASKVLQITDDISDKLKVNLLFLEAGKGDGGKVWIKRGYVPYKSLNNIDVSIDGNNDNIGFIKNFSQSIEQAFPGSANKCRRKKLLEIARKDNVIGFSDYALTSEFAEKFANLFARSYWLGVIGADRFLLLKAAGYFTDPAQQTECQIAAQIIIKSGLSNLPETVRLVRAKGANEALQHVGLDKLPCPNSATGSCGGNSTHNDR